VTITLRDVARAAGVSTASASRALARPQAVSEELRGRILAAAGRLGYAPNLAARALVAGRSGLVAMLVDTLIEPLPAAAAAEMQRSLGREGYSLIIATTGGVHEEALARAREALGRGVEALISWNMADTSGLAEAVFRDHVHELSHGISGIAGLVAQATDDVVPDPAIGCRGT
jgi:DNA-binding LacI/PurR family transcriptional regulator